MKFGIHQSVETLHIEAELGHIQQKAAKLATKRSELLAEMQKWAPNTPQQHQVGFITFPRGLRTPNEAFFHRKIGLVQMNFGAFGPIYQHLFWYCESLVHVFH